MTRPWTNLLAVVTGGVLVDQLSKRWAEANLATSGIVRVVDGLFDFRFTRNPGAFFGIGSSLDGDFRRGFFVAASTLGTAMILYVFAKTEAHHRRLRWGLCLLCAGAIGNLIDRVRFGAVTDFLHLHVGELFHWATFNAADIYIAVGLCLLVLDMLRPESGTVLPAERPAEPRGA